MKEKLLRLRTAVPFFGSAITDCFDYRNFPDNILPIDHVQATAIIPAHKEGAGVIHTFDGAFCTDRRSLHIIHLHQFHTSAGGIFPADAFHNLFTRKSHFRPPLSPVHPAFFHIPGISPVISGSAPALSG